MDASQTLLEMACASADDDDIEAIGIKADISSPVHLVYAADAAEAPRLFIMAGNTMGRFDPLAEIRYIAQCMKPEDRLIVDGEIYESRDPQRGAHNRRVRRFCPALLASVGIAEDDGEIRFDHKRDERHEGLHLITRYFRAERDITATVAGSRSRSSAGNKSASISSTLHPRGIPLAALRAGRFGDLERVPQLRRPVPNGDLR